MTWLTITGAGTTTVTKFFGDATNNLSNLLNGVDVSATTGAGPVEIHNNVIWTYNQANLKLFNPARTFLYKIQTSAITADRTLTLPLLTGADTFAFIAQSQVFTNKSLSDSTVKFISAGDDQKILALSLSGITTGNTRTLTIPDATDTIALINFAQTLDAKTLTSVVRIQNALGTALATTGTVDLDFSTNELVTMAAMTGNVTFTASNYAAARSKTIRIIGGASAFTFTFPATWKFIGAAAPANLGIGKYAVLTLTSISTTEGEVIAAYSVQP
jgi:hypothetical protein